MLAVSLGRNELLSAEQLGLSLLALFPSFLGVFVGRNVRKQIDEARFQHVFLVSVLLLGAYIVVRSVLALHQGGLRVATL
jgi:uncharacterized membrane protein YfcA